MRYLGGGIGHHTATTGTSLGITEGDTDSDVDSEMNLEGTSEDANHIQVPQLEVDDLENPNEEDYEHDDVACTQLVVQDDELQDYEYTQGGADLEMDPDNEESEGTIDSYDLGPEDGEDDEYLHSDLEYD